MLAHTAVMFHHLSLFSHLLRHRGVDKEGQRRRAGDDDRKEDNKAHSCSDREGKINTTVKDSVTQSSYKKINELTCSENIQVTKKNIVLLIVNTRLISSHDLGSAGFQ
jgi:hypothetical protein